MRLARTLRRWRDRAGLSVERAAAELYCGSGTVSRMENGGSAEPLRVTASFGAAASIALISEANSSPPPDSL